MCLMYAFNNKRADSLWCFRGQFPSVQLVQFLLAFSSLVEQVATNVDDMEHREWLEMGFQHSQ